MKTKRLFRFTLLLVACLFATGHAVAQGSLTPPGPPAPTMKSLDQIEPRRPISSLPYTVTNSGSYYLTANLTGVSGSDGIIVQASAVSIDLRGFALVGVVGSLNGVNVTSAQRGLAIFGGVVKSWGSTGINAANASSGEFSRLILSQNSSHGLVAGANSQVRDCVASENSGDGLELTSAGYVANNDCQSNFLCGIHVLGNACRVEANHFGGNGTCGLKVDGSQNLIVKNSAVNNGTNYTIAANNDYGQFYASPGAGFTNSNPWANFSSGIPAPTCSDGIKNGNETDVDCGGGTCPPCATGKNCVVGTDCVSGVCSGNVCAAATCSDGVKNGNETDVDCGGGTCPACATGKQCNVGTDCVSGVCSGNKCVAATCSDGIKDGNETDVDCGGGTCPACATGKHCLANSDCVSGVCSGGVCVAATCSDGIKDGNETDVDCGGGTCPACAVGKGCLVNSDCTSSACDFVTGKCVTSTCVDQRQDGNETDVDCGGGACSPCAVGKHCLVNTDCVAGHVCSGGVCQ